MIGSSLLVAAAAFGLVLGQPLPKGAVQKKYDASLFAVRPPQPNAYFDSYIVKSTPKTGICQVWADTPSSADDAGFATKFDEIKATLSSLYGPSDPMMPKDSKVWYSYGTDAAWKGRALPRGVTDIFLVKAVEPYAITVIYTFANWKACKAASVPTERRRGL